MSYQFESYSQVNYSNDISRNPPKEVKNIDHNNETKPKHNVIYKRIRDIFKSRADIPLTSSDKNKLHRGPF
jgi:hypothetical protein